MTSKEGKSGSAIDRLAPAIGPCVRALGYDLVDLEYQAKSPQGGAVVRLFIDHETEEKGYIGIEDCVKVDRGLTELFESADFQEVFPSEFTLEVSSPGVDRPLTRREHFERFQGKKARIRTFRSLSAAELGDPSYFARNPKQKNFVGILAGWEAENVVLDVDGTRVLIPFELVAKAQLDIADELLQTKNLGKNHKGK